MRAVVTHRTMLRECNDYLQRESANRSGKVFNERFEEGLEGYDTIGECSMCIDTMKDRLQDGKLSVLKLTATSPMRCGVEQVGLHVEQGEAYTLTVSGCSTSRSKPFVRDEYSGESISWEDSPSLEMGLHLTDVFVTFVAVSSRVSVGLLFVKPKQGENMFLGKISLRPSKTVDVDSAWDAATKIKQMEEFIRKWEWKLSDSTNAASVAQFALNEPNCTYPALKARVTNFEPAASSHDFVPSSSLLLTRKAAGPEPCLMSLENPSALEDCAWLSDQIRVLVACGKKLRVWNSRTQLCERDIEGHEAAVRCCAVSKTWILSGGDDCQVKLWTLRSGRCKKTYKGHSSSVTAVCVVDKPRLTLASGSEDKTVKLWSVESTHCLCTLTGHSAPITCVAVVPGLQPQVVSGSLDASLKLWSIESTQCIETFTAGSAIHCCTLVGTPPDTVCSGSDLGIQLWDLMTGEIVHNIPAGSKICGVCVFRPVGEKAVAVSLGTDRTMKIWNVESASCLKTIKAHKAEVSCLAKSNLATPTVATTSHDACLKLWTVDMKVLRSLESHAGPVTCMAFYDIGGSGRPVPQVSTSDHNNLKISGSPAFSSRVVLTGSEDAVVKVWCLQTGNCIATLIGHEQTITCLLVLESCSSSRSRCLLSGSVDGAIKRWDIAEQLNEPAHDDPQTDDEFEGKGTDGKSMESIQTFAGHKGQINCLVEMNGAGGAASAGNVDGSTITIISASSDHTLRSWSLASGTELQVFVGHKAPVRCCFCLGGGSPILASGGDDRTIRVWNMATGHCETTMLGHSQSVTGLHLRRPTVGPKPAVISCAHDRSLKVWSTNTSECLQTMDGHAKAITCSDAMGGKIRKVVTGSADSSIIVWGLDTGEKLASMTGHEAAIACVCIVGGVQPAVISGSVDMTVKVWDMNDGTCFRTLEGHTKVVTCCATLRSDQRTLLASGSDDTTVRVWDLESGKSLRTLVGHQSGVSCVVLMGGHKITVISGSRDHSLRMWSLSSGICTSTFSGHASGVLCMTILKGAEPTVISGSIDKTIKMWHLGGSEIRTLHGHTNWVTSCKVAEGVVPKLVSSSNDRSVKVWDVETGDCLSTLMGTVGHNSPISTCSVFGDVKPIVTSASNGDIRMWDLATEKCTGSLPLCDDWISELRYASGFAGHGRAMNHLGKGGKPIFIVASEDGWVRMIDAVSHAEIDEYYSYKNDADIPSAPSPEEPPDSDEGEVLLDDKNKKKGPSTEEPETTKQEPLSAPFAVPPHAIGTAAAARLAPARVVGCVPVSGGDMIYSCTRGEVLCKVRDEVTGLFIDKPKFCHPSVNEEVTFICADESGCVAYGTNLGSLFIGLVSEK